MYSVLSPLPCCLYDCIKSLLSFVIDLHQSRSHRLPNYTANPSAALGRDYSCCPCSQSHLWSSTELPCSFADLGISHTRVIQPTGIYHRPPLYSPMFGLNLWMKGAVSLHHRILIDILVLFIAAVGGGRGLPCQAIEKWSPSLYPAVRLNQCLRHHKYLINTVNNA